MRKALPWALAAGIALVLGCGPQKKTETAVVAAPSQKAAPDRVPVRTLAGAVMRTEPAERAASLETLSAGEVMTAVDYRNDYVRVIRGGASGWIHASQLQFTAEGKAFLEARSQDQARGGSDYAKRRARMRGGREEEGQALLRQCAHVHANGKRCLYQTADDSGLCPEHQ